MKPSPGAPVSILIAMLALVPMIAKGGETQIAVASNFKPAMVELVEVFEARTGHQVTVSFGSTGKHYAQLVHGAPFDLFLAADTERPRQLEDAGHAVAGSRFTYAVGKLVLWTPGPDMGDQGRAALENPEVRFVAIANPRTAPYGKAAEQFLRRSKLWESLQSRIVRGENVAQAYAYVRSGNADMGFIALSQVGAEANGGGSMWLVPQTAYDPIEQQAVLLTENPAAMAFVGFLQGSEAREIISTHGYSVP